MRRLLWKEWHEIRWYFLGLLVGPWMLTLWPPHFTEQMGTNYVLDSHSERIQILLLIAMFWGATRLSGENRPGRLSVRTLPISQSAVLMVKLVPGLIVSCLLPLWIHVAVTSQLLPIYQYGLTPLYYISENFWLLLSGYLVSFALSTFCSSVVAVLISWLLVFFSTTFVTYGSVDEFLRAFLALAGLFLGSAIWLKGANVGTKRRVGIGVVAVLIAFPIFISGLYMYSKGTARTPFRLALASVLRRHRSESPGVLFGHSPDSLSPDGRFLMYTSKDWVLNKHRGGWYVVTLKVLDFQHRKTLLEQKDARPITWLPDGKLLIAALEKDNFMLSEWDPDTGKRRIMLRYPCDSEQCPITRIWPRPDGRKIALVISSKRAGSDLWMLDRTSGELALLWPGVPHWLADVAWDGDRFIFEKVYNQYWSIQSDGSDLRRVGIGGKPCADF